MKKEKIVSYVIMEGFSDPIKPKNLQVMENNSLFYLIFDTFLQECNVKNRNGRTYFLEGLRESVTAPHIQELIANKTWKGEAGHPMCDDMKRILTIDPTNTSHKITSIRTEGNFIKGGIETLDDGAQGTRMTKNILQGMEPAFSLRALAPIIKKGGEQLIKAKSHIVTYDWVILPSHKTAYRDGNAKIEVVNKPLGGADTRVNMTNVNEGVMIPLVESQIIDFINAESKNLKLVSNIFEVTTENMKISKDLKSCILDNGGEKYFVNIEDKIRSDIKTYMTKI